MSDRTAYPWLGLVVLLHLALLALWGLGLNMPATAPQLLEVELSMGSDVPTPTKQQQPKLTQPSPPQKPAPQTAPQAVATPAAPSSEAPTAPTAPTAPVVTAPATAPANTNAVARAPSVQSAPPSQAASLTSATVLPNVDAAYLTNPKPSYPVLSRRYEETGVVVLNVLVGTAGEVQSINVGTSAGFERLDTAALASVKTWRFSPGKKAGVETAMWVKVPISFILEKRI